MNSRALFDNINRRVASDREEGDIAYFYALMLKAEYITKVVVSGIVACISDDLDRHRYSLEHKLVRANSLGVWIEVLDTALVGPPAQVLRPEARYLTRDLTEKIGSEDWRYDCVSHLKRAASEFDIDFPLGAKAALRQFFDLAVQLRNRTRGHGATTARQCSSACYALTQSLDLLEKHLKLFDLQWVYLHRNLSGKYRVSTLLNDNSSYSYLKSTREVRIADGVYINPNKRSGAENYLLVSLIYTDPNVSDVFLPNGNFRQDNFEILSYSTNEISAQNGISWSSSPARLPSSETEGERALDLVGNTFSNIPPEPDRYIPRTDLENRLKRELLEPHRHPIVTLTGPGGIGKTTIALKAVHQIAAQEHPPYETILWISARDIDLLDSGPKNVSRRVFTQKDICCAVVDLLEPEDRTSKEFSADHFFQQCLTEGADGKTLFVLDNFETLQNPSDAVIWLDSHIRSPNKILITTRMRDFIGDYPIEISGMLDDEAKALVSQHANWLGVERLLTESYIKELVKESEGHPYAIKILLGQVAKEQRSVNPRRILASSENLLNALFRRTFNALSPAAQRVFLLLCSWRVFVPEVAVEAVSLRPETERFDVSHALEELVKFSLIEYSKPENDAERFIGVSLAASVYGRRELEVSEFKVSVEEDRKILMEFGAGKKEDAHKGVYPRIENLIRTVAARASNDPEELERARPILEYLANKFPKTYLRLADLVLETGDDDVESKKLAKAYIRSYLTEVDASSQFDAWMKLAKICKLSDDPKGEIHAISEASLLPNIGHQTVGNLASKLNNRVRALKDRDSNAIWSSEIRELLGRVVNVMERKLSQLSGKDCSRLAWLYLNIGNPERALYVARLGSEADPNCIHCRGLIDRLG